MKNYEIKIFGIVQGVGFRPFVFNAACELNLRGFVQNTARNVRICLYEIDKKTLENFVQILKNSAPKNAKLKKIEISEFERNFSESSSQFEHAFSESKFSEFKILDSENFNLDSENLKSSTNLALQAPKDYATCEQCLNDLNSENPKNSRFKDYAFTACTQCGSRFSMLYKLPYERENSAMCDFEMCELCRADFENPKNRRFHAQPISCPHCAIEIDLNGKFFGNDALMQTAQILKNGEIVAIKGVGGFAFVCAANSLSAVQNLRVAKNRPHKPFAIMCANLSQAREFAHISKLEAKILQSIEAPIVLLKKRKILKNSSLNSENLHALAPDISTIGVVLAYQGIMHLILKKLQNLGFNAPLVFTSANAQNAPIATDLEHLQNLSFLKNILNHNRKIISAMDDSLVRVIDKKMRFLRKARGFAPHTLIFKNFQNLDTKILSFGANQKATFALYEKNHALISQYVGDLNDLQSFERFEKSIAHYLKFWDFKPEIFACDFHWQYKSTQLAKSFANAQGGDFLDFENLHEFLKCAKNEQNLFFVQHHFAHFCAILGENNILDSENLGIVWDGTGLGTDGKIWGGEAFFGNARNAKRVASFENFKLLGIEAAIKDIRRIAFALVAQFAPHFLPMIENRFSNSEFGIFKTMFERSLNSIETSSVGRLFDSVAWLLGLENQSYDGQAGAFLETMAHKKMDFFDSYDVQCENFEIKLAPIIQGICKDLQNLKREIIAAKFFNTLAKIALLIAQKNAHNCENVYFSGGVFANKFLCEKIAFVLKNHNFRAVFHKVLPSNDECISFGQICAIKAYLSAKK